MSAAPGAHQARPGGRGRRRFRECVVEDCRRGFYGPPGPCPDCRCGARASQLLYRLQVLRAGQPGTRRKLRRVLTAMVGA